MTYEQLAVIAFMVSILTCAYLLNRYLDICDLVDKIDDYIDKHEGNDDDK